MIDANEARREAAFEAEIAKFTTERDEARAEAEEWRKEADAMQEKDWSPRNALVRDFRTLNAIVSVLPPTVSATRISTA